MYRILNTDNEKDYLYSYTVYQENEESCINVENPNDDKNNLQTYNVETYDQLQNYIKCRFPNISYYDENLIQNDVNKVIYPDKILSEGSYGVAIRSKQRLGGNSMLAQKERLTFSSVVKYSKEKTVDSSIHEAYINRKFINPFIQKHKNRNFCMMYSYFMCHTYDSPLRMIKIGSSSKPIPKRKFCGEQRLDRPKLFHVYEYVNGKPLADIINSNLSEQYLTFLLRDTLLQVFASFDMLKSVKYNHNDLHTENVMIEIYKNYYNFEYANNQKIYSTFRAVTIDQGMASCVEDMNVAANWWSQEIKHNIFNSWYVPSLDVYRFMTFIFIDLINVKEADDYYRYPRIIEVLRELINSFFNVDTINLTDYFNTDIGRDANHGWPESLYNWLPTDTLKQNWVDKMTNPKRDFGFFYRVIDKWFTWDRVQLASVDYLMKNPISIEQKEKTPWYRFFL